MPTSSHGATRLNLLKKIGPGILMAGAAIGVSHIVQSTRAGATFGIGLVWLVLAVNLLKYPFFEAGHRYTLATGETLLHGYRRLGPAFLYAFLALNTFTAIISIAGTTFVTAILAPKIPGLEFLNPTQISALLLILIFLIVSLGQYKWLSRIIKVMMTVLFIATIAAFLRSVGSDHQPVANFTPPEFWAAASLPFVIALMGWMPAPIELSVWQSLWIQAAEKENKERTSHAEGSVDFHVGYIMTTVLAAIFVALGAWVMYGSGESYADSSTGFTQQFVSLYTSKLGAWTAPIIAAAAFTTLLSTTITVVDAYPRSLAAALRLVLPSLPGTERKNPHAGNPRLQHRWLVDHRLLRPKPHHPDRSHHHRRLSHRPRFRLPQLETRALQASSRGVPPGIALQVDKLDRIRLPRQLLASLPLAALFQLKPPRSV